MKSDKFTGILSPLTQLRDTAASVSSSLCWNVTLIGYLHNGLRLHPVSVDEGGCCCRQILQSRYKHHSRFSVLCLASPPGGAVQCGPLKPPKPWSCLLVSRQSGQEPYQTPHCGCRSNTMASNHTNPGFMDDLKHLGQPFVPFVCRHLRKQTRDYQQWFHQHGYSKKKKKYVHRRKYKRANIFSS